MNVGGSLMRKFQNLVIAVVVLFLNINIFAGTFADTHGFSAKGIGFGNAMTPVVDDYSSVFYNPAGLGKTYKLKKNKKAASVAVKSSSMSLKKKVSKKKRIGHITVNEEKDYINELAVNILYSKPMLEIDISRNDVHGTEELDFAAAIIGVALDLNLLAKMPDFISSARFGLGLGNILPDYAAKINDIDLRTHNFLRYGRNIQVTKILAGFGFGFLDDIFGIGFGVNMSFGGEGVNKLSNVEMNSETTQVPEAETKMDQTTVTFITAGLYFSPGRFYSLLKGVEIGVVYRQESYLEIYPVYNDAHMQVGNMTMPMVISMFGFYMPHVISGGVAYTIYGATVSIDFEFQMWAKFRASHTRELIHDALVSQYNEDGEDGSLYAIPQMRNVFSPKIGVSYKILDWLSASAGYYYQPAFTKDNSNEGKINILDNDKHITSIAVEFNLPKYDVMGGPVSFTLSYQNQYLVPREVKKREVDEWDPNYAYGGMVHAIIFATSIKL